jgi:hypothetical protein
MDFESSQAWIRELLTYRNAKTVGVTVAFVSTNRYQGEKSIAEPNRHMPVRLNAVFRSSIRIFCLGRLSWNDAGRKCTGRRFIIFTSLNIFRTIKSRIIREEHVSNMEMRNPYKILVGNPKAGVVNLMLASTTILFWYRILIYGMFTNCESSSRNFMPVLAGEDWN